MTLLGDREQDVFGSSYKHDDSTAAIAAAFPRLRSRVLELNRAYRSSRQITDFATALLPSNPGIQAFARDGVVPRLELAPRKALNQLLVQRATELRARHPRVAIITRSAKEAAGLTLQLNTQAPELQAQLLDINATGVGTGLMVLPVYLAKGLEFDACIAWQVDQEHYTAKDGLILYTVATRAQHELLLLGTDTPDLLQGAIQAGLLVTSGAPDPATLAPQD